MRICTLLTCLTLCLPSLTWAGSLEPAAAPGPTMKSLDELPPSWSQHLDSTNGGVGNCNSSRFRCVMNNEAVLDLETGLVWEKTPHGTVAGWTGAMVTCQMITVGQRGGWRLPSVSELGSLVDTSSGTGRLPASHPFTGLQDAIYYLSSTTVASDTTKAWGLGSDLLTPWQGIVSVSKSGTGVDQAWCVRGGFGDVPY